MFPVDVHFKLQPSRLFSIRPAQPFGRKVLQDGLALLGCSWRRGADQKQLVSSEWLSVLLSPGPGGV